MKKRENLKSLKNKINKKSDLIFRIIDKKSKKSNRFNLNIN